MGWLETYRNRWAKKTFVLKLGGALLGASALRDIIEDIRELRATGVRIVVVHGGGPQMDDLAAKLGHVPTKIDGRRVTGEKDIEIARMVLPGDLNTQLVGQLRAAGVNAVGLSGIDGHLVTSRKRPSSNGVDWGYVGDVRRVNPDLLTTLLDAGFVPVVCPLSATADGTVVNINADTIGTEIAASLQAEKLVFFGRTDGVMDKQGDRMSVICTDEIQVLIDNETLTGGMVVKLHNAQQALENGVKRVHLLSGMSSHTLHAEVYSAEGVGTMVVTPDEFTRYNTEEAT